MTAEDAAPTAPDPAAIDAEPESWGQAVFGHVQWQAPRWWQWLWTDGRPLIGVVVLLLALASLLWWAATRPKPVPPDAISVQLQAPQLTDYTQSPPQVRPLLVTFGASVAPIERVGKEAPGVRLEPAQRGNWVWQDDRRLLFTPAADWPVGAALQVIIDPRHALAPGRRLQRTRVEFQTVAFSAQWERSEFYQDPQDRLLKKAVWTLSFSHPVDAARLEPALALKLTDGAGRTLPPQTLATQYDEYKLKAYVHSAPLALPENGGKAQLELKPGAASLLGGPSLSAAMQREVDLPALYSVRVNRLTPTLVDNDRFEPEQVLVLEFNSAMREREVNAATRAWLLPTQHPRKDLARQSKPYHWSAGDIDEVLLREAEALPLQADPAEREYLEVHSYRYQAPPGRYLYVRVEGGLQSFGGFMLGQPQAQVLRVPDYPQLLRFVGEGSLLSLRGERRITAVARNLHGLRLEVGRVSPEQLPNFVQYNQGSFTKPQFWNLDEDSLVERMEKRVRLPSGDPARTHYEGIDLSEFFAGGRHGVFLLSLRTMSPQEEQQPSTVTLANASGRQMDARLVVLTDLGVVAKRVLDGSREVYVQSLANGTPLAGVRVRAMARNGETLVSVITDGNGHASLPRLDEFRREKAATLLAVSLGDDLSFLPLRDYEHGLDFSRFDIGGDSNEADPGTLKAHVFSDRGLYRPGDTINLGFVVRAADWARSLAGIPLELDLTDPRGALVRRQRYALDTSGLDTLSHTPPESAASGSWQATLYLMAPNQRRIPIGSTTVQVREFLPDTLRVRAQLSSSRAEGWVKPDQLKATVRVENLFGTPAQDRRVEASVLLRPALPAFTRWPGYRFHDPMRAEEGFSESLPDGRTNAEGVAEFELGLERFVRASYQLSVLVRAFEPGSGRNVAAETATLVSGNDYLVGIKSDSTLGHVARGSQRALELVAIGEDAQARAVEGLRAVLIERRYVSVLTRERSGLYKYVSQERRVELEQWPLAFSTTPITLPLPSAEPGQYVVEVRDGDERVLNRIDYQVAGAANVARSLERNAELVLSLSSPDYRAGEEIEIGIRAPYVGSGLITIERDKVYAHAWFRADTTSSVQRIRIPPDFEGSGYVNVQFVRDPQSDEVYMSPLSYAVVPFSVDRGARTQPLQLSLAPVSRPGAELALDLRTEGRARVVVFAIDEGILQVARYRLADPLDLFFRKKMLQVDTHQILDLILPEFSRLLAAAAAGGDADGGMGKHLNPFKRKSERPATWWSGPIDVDGEHTFKFSMPDHFNGEIRVMAIAVNPRRIGIAQTKAVLRGDFVLTPTVPTHVAPGDVFELPVGIAHTGEGDAGIEDTVQLEFELPPALTLVGSAPAAVALRPGDETTLRLRLRAGEALGAQPITLRAVSGDRHASRRIELSLRPAIMARQDLRIGRADRRTVLAELRDMYPERAQRTLSASTSPFVLIDGLSAYLAAFPHQCTEQVLSQAIPALVYRRKPEFGRLLPVSGNAGGVPIGDMLRTRQNAAGGFGTWLATPDADPFVSAWAALYLVEARERSEAVAEDMLQASNAYLARMAGDAALRDLHQLRARALAVYLLVRQGQTATHLLASVHEQLKRDYPKRWESDATAALLAASYAQLQQPAVARELLAPVLVLLKSTTGGYASGFGDYYDNGIETAWFMYLLHKHFPREAGRLPPSALERLLAPLRDNRHNTLSAALTVLALEAYSDGMAEHGLPSLSATDAKGQQREIGEAFGQLLRGSYASEDRSLAVLPPDGAPAWYALSQQGFDRVLPAATQSQGLEVQRSYTDADGQPLDAVALGQEVTVVLRLRALGANARGSIALVDLLPGGFEPVMQMPPQRTGGDDEDESNEDSTQPPPRPTLALPGSSMHVQHSEVREDRVVLYTYAGAQVVEFRYRIRASNPGEFVVPPPYAESMYERSVYAQGGPAGTLVVRAAGE